MTTDVVAYILKTTEQLLIQKVVMVEIEKISAALFGSSGTTAATAKKVAESQAVVQADAGQASADVFVQAIESIGFPQNLVVAPTLAATTHGEVEALGAFEQGGLALATGRYILHEGEGVMTSRQTAALDRAANVTNNNAGARHFHTTVIVNHNGTNLSDNDIAQAVTRAVRRGSLKYG